MNAVAAAIVVLSQPARPPRHLPFVGGGGGATLREAGRPAGTANLPSTPVEGEVWWRGVRRGGVAGNAD